MTDTYETERQAVEELRVARAMLKTELSKVIIGQESVVDHLLLAVFSGGHCLLTGAPGLAKTLLVQSLSELFNLSFQRIQFTPDLMPADVTGSEILEETKAGRRMAFVQGPVFANMVLADEINRTPPKTQAALLEAMQERHVTSAGRTHDLPEPFYVFATQNPIEMEGTYPLPEAQLDRFMFNLIVDYLPEDDEVKVVTQTTAGSPEPIEPIFDADQIQAFQRVVRQVPIAEEVVRYAVRLASASRPRTESAPDFINEWISWGAGLRAAQYLVLGGKARTLLDDRTHVTPDDILALAKPVLRHRILVNYRAEAEGITVEGVIEKLLEAVNPADRPA